MKILVLGGAGYIGSHLVREIVRKTNHKVVVADSLVASHGKMPKIEAGVAFEKGDVRDEKFMDEVFTKHKPIDAVVHMCAFISVPESVADPLSYYDNNVIGSIRILQAMKRHGCRYLVFSSTAALFGTPKDSTNKREVGKPIEPDDPISPESPYGETKLVMEWLLKDCDKAYGIRSVCLRYFNACGAHDDGDIGENHDPESHLIPIILQVPLKKREFISVFGNDYTTNKNINDKSCTDGTCVRDYIHVTDLSDAHIRALKYLEDGGKSDCFNLGVGDGFSVKEVIEVARKVTNHPIPEKICERRPGDPPVLIASAAKAKNVLGWEPKYKLEEIIKSAWKYHQTHPNGLGK